MSVQGVKKELEEQKVDLDKVFQAIGEGAPVSGQVLREYLERYDKQGRAGWKHIDSKKMELLLDRLSPLETLSREALLNSLMPDK